MNYIALLYPVALVLFYNTYEDYTEGDLNELGIRLAQEAWTTSATRVLARLSEGSA